MLEIRPAVVKEKGTIGFEGIDSSSQTKAKKPISNWSQLFVS